FNLLSNPSAALLRYAASIVSARLALRVALLLALLMPAFPLAQNAACAIGGAVTSNGIALPGVVVSLTSGGQVVDVTSTGVDGAYSLRVPASGAYTVKAELTAFAPLVRDVTIDPTSCAQRVDLVMALASRVNAAPNAPLAPAQGRRGQAPLTGRQQPQSFQSVQLLADQNGAALAGEPNAADADSPSSVLPPGFSVDASADSITAVGTATQDDVFFGPNGAGDFAQRFGAFDGGQAGDAGGAGGPGGQGRGGFGGRGGF